MNYYKDITYYLELTLLDNKGNRVSGQTVTYNIYKSSDDTLFKSGTLSEIGITGVYKDSVIYTEAIQYRVEYTTPSKYDDLIETYIIEEFSLSDIYTIAKRSLGLSKENIRLFDPVYNSDHRLLSATFKIYDSKSDTESDINVIATYDVIAEYNIDNELIAFREVKI